MDELIDELAATLQPADIVLTGGRDPVSLLIQIGSQSPFSHIALATGANELTEAYDYALTPIESDEGIFRLPVDEFIRRSTGLCRVLVLRPVGIDQRKVVEIAGHLLNHSPGFPTTGMAFLALCGLSVPLLRRLPAASRSSLSMRQIRLAADGIRRMHCGETVTRIYHEAGFTLHFTAPRLQFHIAELAPTTITRLVDLPTEGRLASKGAWPEARQPLKTLKSTLVAARTLGPTIRERVQATDEVDMADLILPGDFVRAEPFDTVARYTRSRTDWAKAP